MKGLHGIIFSYEKEPGLRELVEHRMPGSIPFGGRYRVIDFMLSNMHNAGITDVGVVLHGNYQSLMDHLGNGKTWDMSRKYGGLKLLPPFATDRRRYPGEEFRGKMEALAQVRSYLAEIRQDYVVLADSDVIVNLPLADVFEAHLASGADITCVCTEQYKSTENATFFVLGEDNRVRKTLCDPQKPEGCHGLEIYILSRELLLRLVDECAAEDKYSFRRDVLGSERDLDIRGWLWDGFAAQIRTLKEYYDRSMDMLEPGAYHELSTPERPIYAKEDDETATYIAPDSSCVNSLVADGCVIEGKVENCIVFPGVHVAKGADVRNCVLFKDASVGEGAELRYVIADKHVKIRAHAVLTGDENYPMAISKNSVI